METLVLLSPKLKVQRITQHSGAFEELYTHVGLQAGLVIVAEVKVLRTSQVLTRTISVSDVP